MDQASLLAKLQELQIQAEHHHHDAVMTCEAQVTFCQPCAAPVHTHCSAQAYPATTHRNSPCQTQPVPPLQAQALVGVAGVGTKNLFLKVCSPPLLPAAAAAAGKPLIARLRMHALLHTLALQDKRGKLYIATALVDTEVNLKCV